MQKEFKVDSPEYGKIENLSSTDGGDPPTFSKKKRRRRTKGSAWSKQEEDKILKYALKLSHKEFQNTKNQQQSLLSIETFEQIPDVMTYKASEEDFKNPIEMFDRLWSENQESTGIIKIIPPTSWVELQKQNFQTNCLPRFMDPSKRLLTRRQTLNELYLAKVIIP
jgi:hypothetical protein